MKQEDISVIIPTLNCRPLLEPVLPHLRETLRNVGEVIVVDSHSEDGTLELLRAGLDVPGVRYFNHPPGLYASWNFGIRQASRPLLHIATAGDVIGSEDLIHLLEAASSSGADVVTSAPRFVDEVGTQLPDAEWPIFDLLSRHPELETVTLSGLELLSFAITHCRPPIRYNSWLGSSASNLYRTSTLQARPFPVHAGHSGDALWGLENARSLSAVFCRRRCGRFVMHTRHPRMTREQREAVQRVYQGPWDDAKNHLIAQLGGPEISRVLHLLISDNVHLIQLKKLRAKLKRRLPWVVRRLAGLHRE